MDRGAQFTSGTWSCWCQDMQVKAKHIKTTAFHPQANGMVERLHRQLKDTLHARDPPQSGRSTCHGFY